MGAEQTEALVRRLISEVFNEHDLGGLEAMLGPDFVSNWQGSPAAAWHRSLASGDGGLLHCVSRRRLHPRGPLLHRGPRPCGGAIGAPRSAATGKVSPPAAARSVGASPSSGASPSGKLAEDWVAYDRLGLFQQLGALPLPR